MSRVTARCALLLCVAFLPEAALACSVCFGADEGGLSAGLNAGIAVLLGLVFVVQLLIVRFFVRAMRRAREAAGSSPAPREVSP